MKFKIKDNKLIKYKGSDRCVVIPFGVTVIGEKAFKNRVSIKSIIIPNTVKNIERKAFYGCSGLHNIDIPNSVNEINEKAFELCASLESIKLGDGVKKIDDNAFGGCINLKSIYIPKNVESISPSAFFVCNSLKSIKVDKDNKTYDSRDNCNAIIESKTNYLLLGCNSTTIPEGIEIIGFRSLSALDKKEIIIPNSIRLILSYAFAGNFDLKTLDLSKLDHIPKLYFNNFHKKNLIKEDLFYTNTEKTNIKVKQEMLSAFKNAMYWKDYPYYVTK